MWKTPKAALSAFVVLTSVFYLNIALHFTSRSSGRASPKRKSRLLTEGVCLSLRCDMVWIHDTQKTHNAHGRNGAERTKSGFDAQHSVRIRLLHRVTAEEEKWGALCSDGDFVIALTAWSRCHLCITHLDDRRDGFKCGSALYVLTMSSILKLLYF